MTEAVRSPQGWDHAGFTGTDLNEAVNFYSHPLQVVEVSRRGPFDARELPSPDVRGWSLAFANLAAARSTLAMLEFPSGGPVKLFQYDRPTDRNTATPRNCYIGGHHMVFTEEDLDKALDSAACLGLPFMTGPMVVEQGSAAGQRVTYVPDPWGKQAEFVERPDGR